MTRVTTDTTRLNRLIKNILGNARQAIASVAFQVEALAKIKAPVDTGALRSTIYTRFKDHNPVPAEATEVLPEPNDLSAYVGAGVEYAIDQEFGIIKMQAQPFLIPALREVERQLEEHYKGITKIE